MCCFQGYVGSKGKKGFAAIGRPGRKVWNKYSFIIMWKEKWSLFLIVYFLVVNNLILDKQSPIFSTLGPYHDQLSFDVLYVYSFCSVQRHICCPNWIKKKLKFLALVRYARVTFWNNKWHVKVAISNYKWHLQMAIRHYK